EYLRILRALAPMSHIVVTLRGRSAVLGTISLVSTRHGRHYDEEDLGVAQDLASRVGLAVESALLFEAERTAREAAQAAERRVRFLAKAGAILGSSLDWRATLQQVSDVVVPEFADWCTIAMPSD